VETIGHRYRDGTWSSPGYRSGRTRANVTLALFAIVGVASLGLIGTGLELLRFVREAGSGRLIDTAALDGLLEQTDSVNGFFLLFAFGLAVAFLAWLSRTVEITPALGGGTPSTSPAWSIIWWFVPIAFLWKPYTVVREVWERLATPERRGSGALVVGWWLAWLGAALLGRAEDTVARGSETWEAFESAAALGVWSSISSLVAAILGFFVVREIQARADLRARALGFEAPLPSVGQPQPDRPTAGEATAPDRTPGASDAGRRTAKGTEAGIAASLRHLRELRDEGLITAEEYERKRSEILDRL
jgi:hypothetical protein